MLALIAIFITALPLLWGIDFGSLSAKKMLGVGLWVGLGLLPISLTIYLGAGYLKVLLSTSPPIKRHVLTGTFCFGLCTLASAGNVIGEAMTKEAPWVANSDLLRSLVAALLFGATFVLHVFIIRRPSRLDVVSNE